MDIRSRILKAVAARPDLTITALSVKAGMSNSALGKFLNPAGKGGIHSMTIEKLEAVARALNVDPRWLVFGDTPEPQRDDAIMAVWDQADHRQRAQVLAMAELILDNCRNCRADFKNWTHSTLNGVKGL